MDIEFDQYKRDKTLQERGLDFADTVFVFSGVHFTDQDLRTDYAEERFFSVGQLGGDLVVIVWTPRGAARRIISMRKANAREIEKFNQALDQSG
jgi:uncharacterized DUF497 family protein